MKEVIKEYIKESVAYLNVGIRVSGKEKDRW